MFFLPAQAKAGPKATFFLEFAGEPIDPLDWLKTCPNEVIDYMLAKAREPNDEPMPPRVGIGHNGGPALAVGGDQLLNRVERAIGHWQATGCVKGKGRSQFYGLAMTLKEAGLSEHERRTILYEQAGFATNPTERRGEIDAHLKL
jgi:hypothetical protein